MLVFMDGFDHYAIGDLTKKWTSNTGAVSLTAGLSSGKSLFLPVSATLTKILPAAYATLIFGCNIKVPVITGDLNNFIELRGAASDLVNIGVTLTANGQIKVYRSSYTTIIATSATNVFQLNIPFHFELKTFWSDTVGTVDVRINGISVISVTNVDTKQDTGASTKIGISAVAASSGVYVDDFYVLDDTGSYNNNFIGPQQITTLSPTGNGTTNQFTPSANTNYQNVSGNIGQITTYNYDSTIGNVDLYNYADVPANTSTVSAIQIVSWADKNETGTRTVAHRIKSGATYSNTASYGLANSVQSYYYSTVETNPATSTPWTASEINAAEFGVIITS